ncbi:MAG: helix-turn-helix transcriptional regulator, partial [Bacteroidaceae bacterium]|nr:helix-turn-helix transcriptional regulator [Bacteroidaceae bacterium]
IRSLEQNVHKADISAKISDMINNAEGREQISEREKEIIVCLVQGMSNKEVAAKLFISVNTVITHRRNITRKLQIHSLAGLTIYAIANNLIEKNLFI